MFRHVDDLMNAINQQTHHWRSSACCWQNLTPL